MKTQYIKSVVWRLHRWHSYWCNKHWWSIYVLCKEYHVSFGVSANWCCSNSLLLYYPSLGWSSTSLYVMVQWTRLKNWSRLKETFFLDILCLTQITFPGRVLGCPSSAVNVTEQLGMRCQRQLGLLKLILLFQLHF